ncbi:hypothetical protein ACLB2K_028242 [Fragaria x ananassa]
MIPLRAKNLSLDLKLIVLNGWNSRIQLQHQYCHGLGGLRSWRTLRRCLKWFKIFKDPSMWRTIDMRNSIRFDDYRPFLFHELCEHAIKCSRGNLVDINVENFGTDVLLEYYIAESSSALKRLCLVGSHRITDGGASCSGFKISSAGGPGHFIDRGYITRNCCIDRALMSSIEIIQIQQTNQLTNKGLCAILDGCPHLESLDLRQCFNLKLGGKLGRRCVDQVKKLRHPHDSVNDIDPSYDFDFDV